MSAAGPSSTDSGAVSSAWPPQPIRARQAAGALLGAFVLAQLVFLATAAATDVIDLSAESRERLPVWCQEALRGLDKARRVTRRWAELTGQMQSWSLFAPDVADYIAFPEVQWSWNVGGPTPLLGLSENEPAQRDAYLRLGRYRLRRFETSLRLVPVSGVPFEPQSDAWRTRLTEQVRDSVDLIRAYLAWRTRALERTRPDLPPPARAVLRVHLFHLPAPPGPHPWDWDDLGSHPVARWQPGRPTVLEVYDPLSSEFHDLGDEPS